MENNEYRTKEAVLSKALELVAAQIPFRELDINNRLRGRNKGDLGQIVEEGWYNYHVNSESEPDFSEAGVELKVSPYKTLKDGQKSAKERLVCGIINYMDEAGKSFEESAFWHKCKCMCLLSYEWFPESVRGDLFADHATLIDGYPEEDLLIMKNDFDIIMKMIMEGRAHELSEGMTQYLAPCTKGSTAEASIRPQPFSDTPAKQRAYSLKTTYMTRLLRKYVFGEEENEHIIKNISALETHSLEEILEETIRPYYGKSQRELKEMFGIEASSKQLNAMILQKIFDTSGNIQDTEEFKSAGIKVKTVRLKLNGTPKESMSFPAFKYMDIINEEWEDSKFKEEIFPTRFMFVVFNEDENHEFCLTKVKFWNMPDEDVEKARFIWEDTVDKIKEDRINFRYNQKHDCVDNDFIASKESSNYSVMQEDGSIVKTNMVCHVRPHGRKAAYILKDGYTKRADEIERLAYPVPNGEWASPFCFWFNDTYIESILED